MFFTNASTAGEAFASAGFGEKRAGTLPETILSRDSHGKRDRPWRLCSFLCFFFISILVNLLRCKRNKGDAPFGLRALRTA